jgi:competence protein ComEC
MPGDSIEYFAKWYSIHPPTIPGTFDTKSWLKSQKLNAYGELKDFKILCSKKTPEYYFYTFKKWMLSRLRAYASPAEAGMLLGLLAGDRSGIPETLQNNFRRTGLVHVLAIGAFIGNTPFNFKSL